MIHFFQNARYQTAPETDRQDGTVIFASGMPLHTLERRDLDKHAHLQRRLLDPQLYLSGLSAHTAADTCTKLASYGWFDASAPVFDSSKQKQSEWKAPATAEVVKTWTGKVPTDPQVIEDRVRVCIEVQQRLGCEAIVLPSPLRTDPSTDHSAELAWLDLGLALAKRIAPGVPRLASIAISDTCLVNVDPWASHMLDTLLDQVSAREPEGAYVVVEQGSHDRLYQANENALGSLVRVVRDLRTGGVPRIIVPLAGVAGMLGAAVGAETWSAGWYKSQRRVRLLDFQDTDETRLAYPTYYSHPLAGEINLKTDLDRINVARLLRAVADETSMSSGLLQALRQGGVVDSVPDWESRASNTSAARGHFAESLLRETVALRKLPVKDRLDAGRRWLDGATKLAAKILALGKPQPRTELGHQAAWLAVLDAAATP